jgi:hypothetical protein
VPSLQRGTSQGGEIGLGVPQRAAEALTFRQNSQSRSAAAIYAVACAPRRRSPPAPSSAAGGSPSCALAPSRSALQAPDRAAAEAEAVRLDGLDEDQRKRLMVWERE